MVSKANFDVTSCELNSDEALNRCLFYNHAGEESDIVNEAVLPLGERLAFDRTR